MSKNRFKIGVLEGTRGHPPPTILPVRKVDESIFYMYKNFGSRIFRFVTMHEFVRRTDGQTDGQMSTARP